MATTIKSENKYLCKDKEKLKALMREEGFIFKNSALQLDEYFIDKDSKLLDKKACIRLRTVNNKEAILSYDGYVKNISSIEVEDKQSIYLDVLQRENVISFLTDLGYYKYVSNNILKETYVKKEREYYYSISIDAIDGIGEFIDYDIYTESEDNEKTNEIFREFERDMAQCLGEKISNKYRDYTSRFIFENNLKGNYLKKILVELEKIIPNIEQENIELSVKNKYSLLNLELIERLEQKNIDISIVYSPSNEEIVNNLKRVLSKVGYTPKFINIKEIKEIAVRETLILEKQKKMDFSEVAFIIINNLRK